jgi:maleylpyruvate isomerase
VPEQILPDLDVLDAATARLADTCALVDDATARRPSLLPGWSVGHVLTHVARNADGLLNLVTWAVSGEPNPMYLSSDARNADIEQGAGRPAAVLVADVLDSAARLQAALDDLAEGDPEALDRLLVFGAPPPGTAPDTPARSLPYARLREVEIHHVDLGLASYTPADWPDAFVERTLLFVHGRSGPVDVVGEPHELLAWRLGRGAGPSLRRLDGTEPGDPPAW